MTQSASTSRLGSEFDDFLFASVGNDKNGMLLSVLSTLARLDVDPWQEAADLARLPRDTAIKRLTSLVAALPGSLSTYADPARLLALLPHLTGFDVASRETSPSAGMAISYQAAIRSVVIKALLVAFLLATQWMAIGHHPPAQSETVRAVSPSTAPPEMPPPSSRQ